MPPFSQLWASLSTVLVCSMARAKSTVGWPARLGVSGLLTMNHLNRQRFATMLVRIAQLPVPAG
jgi:hypothetical protein